ncbi:MAG: hypothetical protein WD845_10015 [Pirellulales bacterium]
MLTALARKEVRELLPLVLLGVALELYLACTATGMQLGFFEERGVGPIPFVSDQTSQLFFYVSGGLAFALGLWQTTGESSRGTFQFLLHRPLAREAIFGTKLAVGASACLGVALLPVATFGLWAATSGTHASPFTWSMTAWAWFLCVQMLLVYLGAFLSGLRPGHWLGSRFLPLAGCVAALLLMRTIADWQWSSLVASLALEIVLVLIILDVARGRDYS